MAAWLFTEKVLAQYDADGTGALSCDEFVHMFDSNKIPPRV